ncbi:hypothetical protein BpHYR1_020505 [Brachionus plicatilis]|uniref:Uncharacterized protein n=1 Tax=Brachionus plicatilis TaxID=10195 RepID=A0A3M7QCN1_BRAPC|nr:hypothetical protein BpHYR1_020505 [Brachionus plicatilis]
MVKVEQQEGPKYCDLLVIAYAQLLANAKDPYHFKFWSEINASFLTFFKKLDKLKKIQNKNLSVTPST